MRWRHLTKGGDTHDEGGALKVREREAEEEPRPWS